MIMTVDLALIVSNPPLPLLNKPLQPYALSGWEGSCSNGAFLRLQVWRNKSNHCRVSLYFGVGYAHTIFLEALV